MQRFYKEAKQEKEGVFTSVLASQELSRIMQSSPTRRSFFVCILRVQMHLEMIKCLMFNTRRELVFQKTTTFAHFVNVKYSTNHSNKRSAQRPLHCYCVELKWENVVVLAASQ